jgi:hypothetical protein
MSRKTGELTIESIPVTLGPGFRHDELQSLAVDSSPQVLNESHRSYSIGDLEISGLRFVVTLYFFGNTLESIELMCSGKEFGSSWEDWSEERELRRKEAHDLWLTKQLGHASHVYEWGEIGSDYDPRSGASTVVIRYRSAP